MNASSSIGRAAVSKTAGWGFESLLACHQERFGWTVGSRFQPGPAGIDNPSPRRLRDRSLAKGAEEAAAHRSGNNVADSNAPVRQRKPMNAKVETAGPGRALDVVKLVLAALVLAAGIAGYYYLADLASSWRMLVVLAGAIAAFTAPGRTVREFLRETQFEMRKVVWPTREETARTTIVVIVVVIALSVILGLIDVLLKWAILDHLLKIGT